MSLLLVMVAGVVLVLAWGADWLRGAESNYPAEEGSPGDAGPGLTVVCSVHPVSELVRMVAGDETAVAVVTLVPPGADPHTFELKPNQAALLREASLVFAVGGGLDPFVDGLAGAAGVSGRIIPLLDAVPPGDLLHEDTGGLPDPHIWLDPVIAREHILPAAAAALTVADPAGEAGYTARLRSASAELQSLHEWVTTHVAPLQAKALITMHPAWAYFGRRYGIETHSVLGAHGTEPTPNRLEELAGIAVQRGIKVLFRERQVPSSSLDALVRSAGGQVMLLDPLGGEDLPGYESYTALIRSNVETMCRGLALP